MTHIYPSHITPSRATFLDQLAPDMAARAVDVLRACAKRKTLLVPYCGRRDAVTQARLWRQSRTTETINAKCAHLRRLGAPKIADLIDGVGPQSGRWATSALPGQSAHQYGLAVDCFLVGASGEAIWNGSAPGYEVFAQEAERHGLIAGLRFDDPVHIEYRIRPYTSGDWVSIQAALEAEGWL